MELGLLNPREISLFRFIGHEPFTWQSKNCSMHTEISHDPTYHKGAPVTTSTWTCAELGESLFFRWTAIAAPFDCHVNGLFSFSWLLNKLLHLRPGSGGARDGRGPWRALPLRTFWHFISFQLKFFQPYPLYLFRLWMCGLGWLPRLATPPLSFSLLWFINELNV